MYLTYEEYQTMGGALDETTFNDLEFEAESLINWHTFNRLKKDTTFPQELKRLMKYLIGMMAFKNKMLAQSGGESGTTSSAIASQSNDGVSISYNVLSAKDLKEDIEVDAVKVIQQYLNGVMNEAGQLLLYRGIYPNE